MKKKTKIYKATETITDNSHEDFCCHVVRQSRNNTSVFQEFAALHGGKKTCEVRKMFSLLGIILLFAGLLLLVAACGNGGVQDNGESGEGEQRIVRITQARVPNIDPAIDTDLSSSIAYVNLYDALVSISLGNEAVPQLAKSWEYTDDGMEWTFYLRDDVVFHDGTPLTASDFVFSLNRLLAIGQGYSYLVAPYIDNAEVLDEHTVRLSLNAAFAPILTVLCRVYVLNERLIMANLADGDYGAYGDYGTGYLLTNSAGSGAYKVKELRLMDRLVMEQNQGYWRSWDARAPQVAEIIGSTEPATIRTLMSNYQLEITDNFQSPETLSFLSTLEGAEVATMPSGVGGFLMLNQTRAPLDDVHVRRALAYMLDRVTIGESIFVGSQPMRSCVPSPVAGFTDQVEQYEYDLGKAAEELEKSKYYGQFDQYPITIQSPGEVPAMQLISLMLQATANQLGLTLNVEEIPWISFIENVASPETTAHISISMVTLDYPEAGSMLFNRFHSSMNGTWMQAEWMSDSILDAMIEDALLELDTGRRFAKYRDIQVYVQDQCYSINAFEEWPRFAYRSSSVSFPAADSAAKGGSVSVVMGYNHIFHEFRVLE